MTKLITRAIHCTLFVIIFPFVLVRVVAYVLAGGDLDKYNA